MDKENCYDIVYKTKYGRLMVAKRVCAPTKAEAEKKLKRQMRKSSTFKKIITSIKL